MFEDWSDTFIVYVVIHIINRLFYVEFEYYINHISYCEKPTRRSLCHLHDICIHSKCSALIVLVGNCIMSYGNLLILSVFELYILCNAC